MYLNIDRDKRIKLHSFVITNLGLLQIPQTQCLALANLVLSDGQSVMPVAKMKQPILNVSHS